MFSHTVLLQMNIIFLHVFLGHSVRHCRPHNMEKAHASAGKGHGFGSSYEVVIVLIRMLCCC